MHLKLHPAAVCCPLVRYISCILFVTVCNEWTELSCTSEAAPEALEEHSMVAHEVQTQENLHLSVYDSHINNENTCSLV